MMKKLNLRLILSLLLLAIFIVGCAKKPQELVIGKWRNIKDSETIEFFEDGTLRLSSTNPKASIPSLDGKWVILSDGRLKAEVTFLGSSVSRIGGLNASNDEITLKDDSGKEDKYTKIKQTQ